MSRLLLFVMYSMAPAAVVAAHPFEQGSGATSAPLLPSAVMPPPSDSQPRNPRTGTAPARTFIVELNGGAVRPNGPMRLWIGFDGKPLFSDTWWGGITFGRRVTRLVQIDVGFEATGHVVGPKRDSFDERVMRRTSFGDWVPRDPNLPLEDPVSDFSVLMMPFGLRFVLPLLGERVSIGLGGGGAFLLHGEASDRVHPVLGRGCARSCEDRYGLGAHGLARLDLVLGAAQRVGVGIVARYTRARLSGGQYLPSFSASGVKDQWLQVGGSLSIRF